MPTEASAPPDARPGPAFPIVLIAAFAVVLAWLGVNLFLEYPYMAGDEAEFLKWARASTSAEQGPGAALHSLSPVHSLLYSVIFSAGVNFFVVARMLNALWCGLSVLPAYYLSRRFMAHGPALAVALMVGLNPWNSESSNVMPESLYGMLFWCLAWAMLAPEPAEREPAWRTFARLIVRGSIATALFFTKSHALTLILVCALMLAFRSWRGFRARSPDWMRGLVEVGAFLGVVFAGMGAVAVLADRSLVDIFYAGRYRGEAEGLLAISHPGETVRLMARQFAGSLGHMGVLYGVPLAAVLFVLPRAWRPGDRDSERVANLCAFVPLAIGLTMFFAAKFVTDLAIRGSEDMAVRLLERYYGHLLPLLALLFFTVLPTLNARLVRGMAAGFGVLSAVVLAAPGAWGFRLFVYDAPNYYWVNPVATEPRAFPGWILAVVVLAAVAHLAWFVVGRRYTWRSFACLAALIYAVAIVGAERQLWRQTRNLVPMHEYSSMTRHLIGSDWEHTVLLGDDFRVAAFSIMLRGDPTVIRLPEGAKLPLGRLPRDTRWLIRLHTQEPSAGLHTETVFKGWSHGTVEILRIVGRDDVPADGR